MRHDQILCLEHMDIPLQVRLAGQSQLTLTVLIGDMEVHIERPGSEELGRHRAHFLYALWEQRLTPVFRAGYQSYLTAQETSDVSAA